MVPAMRWVSNSLVVISFTVVGACAGPKSASNGKGGSGVSAGATGAEARVLALGDALVQDNLEHSPERAVLLRIPGARYDRLPDESVAGVEARRKKHKEWLTELQAIDRRSLEGQAALTYDIALENLEDYDRTRVCRYELWAGVSQMINGWQVRLANLAQAQPIGTDEYRAQALARFSAVPAYADAQIANMREGLKLGYTAAKVNVKAVLEQVDRMLELSPTQSPFFLPAVQDPTPAFRQSFEALVRDQIHPALRRYRDFLEKEYLPKARDTIGVSANPDGLACYRAAVRMTTTVDKSPEEIQATGQQQLAKIEAEIKEISNKSFGGTEVKKLLERFRSDKEYTYKNRDEMLAQAQGAIDRARAAMPRAFHLMPKADVKLEPIPKFQEKNAAAHYLSSAIDGSRAATYRIRLYQPEQQSRVMGETTAFHETIPGHHLQIAIAVERSELPSLARFSGNSGFSEGWALYAERLADELGLFSDDATRIGMLSAEAWRAVRLIVDSGMHALGWDRQRAIDMMLAHTAMSPDQAASEVDRYIAWPSQATAYMIGYLEIRALRVQAEKELGSKFDLRAFHDRVLENGSIPLPLLRQNVERWIAKERG